jgi:hypothetical protein
VNKKVRALTVIGSMFMAVVLIASAVWARFAYRRLFGATEFSSLFVGQPPVVSPQALDFNIIIRLPGGARRYRSLVSDASPAGQLYGLCGLYLDDRKAFQEMKPRYSHRAEAVNQTIGCLSVKGPLRSVVFADGQAIFEDSCVSLKLTLGEWLRARFGRLRPR